MESIDDWFRSLYIHYMPLLRSMARKRGIPEDDVEDVVQDTFLSFYVHYSEERSEDAIKRILARTIQNKCIDYYRRKSVRPMEYLEVMEEKGVLPKTLIGKDTLSSVVKAEEYHAVHELLKSMKSEWREVFVLYIIQGRSMQEVSECLGLSETACRMRLSRGRKYLRDRMNSGNGMIRNNEKSSGTSDDSEVPEST